MGSSASRRVASPGGSAVVGQTGIMGAPGGSLLRPTQLCASDATAWAGKPGTSMVHPASLGATYAHPMGGPHGENAERASAAVVQSVDRALSVLEILAAQGEAGVTEVAAELG